MNEVESPESVPMRRKSRTRPMDDADMQFLPPADQILATPPSPIRMRLMLAICLLFLTALVSAWLGKIEIYAVASGRIQPTGRSKVVQPMQSGKVRAIRVTNGSHVNEGDTLLELDATESAAELEASVQALASLRAEIARRATAIDLATRRRFTSPSPIGFEADIDEKAAARQQAVLDADIAELRASLNSFDSQIAENNARKSALQATIAQQRKLVATLEQRFAISDSVEKQGLESKSNVLEVRQALDREVMALSSQTGELSRTDASTGSLRTNKENAIAKFIAQNTQALDIASGKRDEMTGNFVKTTARVGYMRLTAPIAGTVQELTITTVGQVVISGQQLMTIVPGSAHIEAEALVLNRDIGFVEPGQDAVLKIDAFPFTRYGSLSGKVVHVSQDSVNSNEASMSANATVTPSAAKNDATSGVPQLQNLVFPVTVSLTRASILIDGKEVPLTPGMSATIEIQTGKRRILEYFLSPLLETVSKAAHER